MNNEAVKSAIEEMVNCLYQIQAQKDLMKSIIERVSEEHSIAKKDLRKMAKFAYTMDLAETKAELEAIEAKLAEIGIE